MYILHIIYILYQIYLFDIYYMINTQFYLFDMTSCEYFELVKNGSPNPMQLALVIF